MAKENENVNNPEDEKKTTPTEEKDLKKEDNDPEKVLELLTLQKLADDLHALRVEFDIFKENHFKETMNSAIEEDKEKFESDLTLDELLEGGV